MALESPPLIFLPGIGGNSLLFEKQKPEFPQARVPEWLEPYPNETLKAYVTRWSPDWATGGILVGMSFGGMVALELARQFPVRAVVLISSLWDKSVISRQFAILERLSRTVPNSVVRPVIRSFGPGSVRRRNRLSAEDEKLMRQMANDLDLDFARWACRAVASWEGALDLVERPSFKLSAVHGAKDPVLYLPKPVPSWVQVVQEGRHLLPYSHPEVVNEVIRKALSSN